MSLTAAEKRRILNAIKKDEEFRLALMGLLGFKELLNRFAKLEERQQRLEERQQKLEERFARLERRFARLEERQQKLEERFARIEERFARLEERQQRLEERQQKLEERQQRLEERFARLEERQQRLEERQQRLEERFARLEERQQRLEERFARLEERQQRLEEKFARLEERQQRLEEKFARLEERQQRLEERMLDVLSELRELRRVVTVIAHRFGVLTESSFREAMRHVVEEVLGVGRVERWIYRDEDGFVYGYPSVVEVDVVVKDGRHVLIEVKSRVSRGDVAELHRIGVLYERVMGVKPDLVIVGGFIDPGAYKAGAKLGVEIKPAIKED